MKLTQIKFIICALAGASLLSACNAKTSDEASAESVEASSSTLVSAFSLKANYNQMAYLDSVFFSIDQVHAQIYNADSLPCGTDVRKLLVSITAPSSASRVSIVMPSLTTGLDTTVNYLSNPSDSINFSHGSVRLLIASESGEYERAYTVKVNVHAINADSLQWRQNVAALPGSLTGLTAQKAVEFQGKYYSFTTNAISAQVCVSADPLNGAWVPSPTNLPEGADINTICAGTDYIFLLAGDELYRSADGMEWTSCQSSGWSWLYGCMDSEVIGVNGGQWLSYPSGACGAIAPEMPVSGTSAMWSYTTEWNITPQAMMVGGVRADGTEAGDAWAFDGFNWVRLNGSQRSLPAGQGHTLFPYFAYRGSDTKFFINTKHSAWIAICGRTVYTSLDNGVNWLEAPQEMQMPAAYTWRTGVSALIADRTFHSRATRPITQWDCPYILLPGGRNASGAVISQLWIGAINRLTFKPLQ